jgi:hypothetical protein
MDLFLCEKIGDWAMYREMTADELVFVTRTNHIFPEGKVFEYDFSGLNKFLMTQDNAKFLPPLLRLKAQCDACDMQQFLNAEATLEVNHVTNTTCEPSKVCDPEHAAKHAAEMIELQKKSDERRKLRFNEDRTRAERSLNLKNKNIN